MQHNIKGTNLDLTAEVRAYVDKKLAGLDDLLANKGAARADVELGYLPSEDRNYRAEFMIHDGPLWRAEAHGRALHEAIDKAVQDLFIELSRSKRKKRNILRRGAARIKEYVRGWRSQL